MSSGPSTFGIMITSSLSPISVTSVVRSSSAHGESRLLTRVQSCVSPKSMTAPDLRPGRRGPPPCCRPGWRPRGCRAARRPSADHVGQLGDHLLVARIEEVDHPRRPDRDLAHRGRAHRRRAAGRSPWGCAYAPRLRRVGPRTRQNQVAHELRSAGTSCSVSRRSKRGGSPATKARHSGRPST